MTGREFGGSATNAGTSGRKKRLMFVVNHDSFFVSHRVSLGAACVSRGYDVVVCAAPSGGESSIRRLGMRFLPLKLSRGSTNPVTEGRTLAELVRIYAREQPDIVHHVTIKPVLYGSMAAKMVGIGCVVNAISGMGYAFIPRANDSVRNKTLRHALWLAYRSALGGQNLRVIFQNDDDRETFVQRKIVRASQATLIHGAGVDLDLFYPSATPPGPFLAVLPARMLKDKGVEEFVAAARRLKVRAPEARFALVGPIDVHNPACVRRESLEAWVKSGDVEWWGEQPRTQMAEVYRQAHVVVLPSYREGLSLALAEASASGRACVTTDVPGCRDVVVDGQTGWLVPPRDVEGLTRALWHCISDREELTRRGFEAAHFARSRFGSASVIQQTLAIYDELLYQNARQRR